MVRSLLRLSLTLAAFAFLTGSAAHADTAGEKAGNQMEKKGGAEEKAADATKAKGSKMENDGKAEEKAGKKANDKDAEAAGKAKKKKGHAIEKAGGFTGKGSPDAFDFTTRRLAAGSQMLLDLWYTAWLDSATGAAAQGSAAVPPNK